MDCVFFFKQKTAYEMRISDWSSDVCSSDLWDLACITCGWSELSPRYFFSNANSTRSCRFLSHAARASDWNSNRPCGGTGVRTGSTGHSSRSYSKRLPAFSTMRAEHCLSGLETMGTYLRSEESGVGKKGVKP